MAVLPCTLPPQRVSPAVTWSNSKGSIWKMQSGGMRFYSASWGSRVKCPHKQFHEGDYSLQIFSVREEDAGFYTCTLETNNKRTTTVTVTLRIIKVSISPPVPLMGQNVFIQCSVSEGEVMRLSGATKRWMLNGRPYEPQDSSIARRIKRDQNMALRIKGEETMSGNWTCVVNSKDGEGRASALLDVKGIIQPPSDNAQVYAAVGSAVTLPCVFSDGLTPSNAFWERLENKTTSKPLTLPPSFSAPSPSLSSGDKTAAVNEVSFEDAGQYRCSASVLGLKTQRRLQLVTAKVEVEILSKEAVELTCRLSDPSAVTKYKWIYTTFDLNGTEFTASVQTGQRVTVSQTSGGQWTCLFYGQQGLLGNVTHHIHNMEGQWGKRSVRVSHNAVLLLVGLTLLVLILLFVLIQMYRNYQRRNKAFQFLALESVLHNNSLERELDERSKQRCRSTK
ncbi:lymphocyte activation gene 3 protein isoform X2 [Boleophthalmus pectinirostris]|nr:lymphocyte activation gene 3 protein isoform X2 [Boleophthalmus pectinirostris]XP_055019794.1 lymphocyte activation gene 3 protein isoform X2 [Boleophthalmus pectinirostris]